MRLNFDYSCTCKVRYHLNVNKFLDRDYQHRLDEFLNDIIDRSWDEQDTEILSLMTAVIHKLRGTNVVKKESTANDSNLILSNNEVDLAVMKTIHNPSTKGCVCLEISHKLSVIIDAGLAELNIEHVREESLVEKVNLLRPFVSKFNGDIMFANFCIRSWKRAIQWYFPKLIEELTIVYPQYLKSLMDGLIENREAEYDSLLLRKEFKYLSRCLTIGRSFYAILAYLAEKNHAAVQPLISACITFAKAELHSEDYYNLFPLRLRPYAIIMNEIINPYDPDVETLVEQLQTSHPNDYRILITISPVFYCLHKVIG